MTVVGRDRSWYVLSKMRGQPSSNPDDGLNAWRAEFVRLTEEYEPLVEFGVLTSAEALGRSAHEALELVAPQLHLRYDQIGR
jgi:hypothetical protein